MRFMFALLLFPLISWSQPGPRFIETSLTIVERDSLNKLVPIADFRIIPGARRYTTIWNENFPETVSGYRYGTRIITVNGNSFVSSSFPDTLTVKHNEQEMKITGFLDGLYLVFTPGVFTFPANSYRFTAYDSIAAVLNSDTEHFRVQHQAVQLDSSLVRCIVPTGLERHTVLSHFNNFKGGNFVCSEVYIGPTIYDPKQLHFGSISFSGNQPVYKPIAVLPDSLHSSFLTDLFFRDAQNGWLILYSGITEIPRGGMLKVYETHDGGKHWKRLTDAEEQRVFAIRTINRTDYAFSINEKYEPEIFRLNHWEKPVAACSGKTCKEGFSSFNAEVISGKITGSHSFDPVSGMLSSEQNISSLAVVNDKCIFRINTTTSQLERTIDGGLSWKALLPVIKGSRVAFRDTKTGVVIDNELLLITRDGGETWHAKLLPVPQSHEMGFNHYASYLSYSYVQWVNDLLFVQCSYNSKCYVMDVDRIRE